MPLAEQEPVVVIGGGGREPPPAWLGGIGGFEYLYCTQILPGIQFEAGDGAEWGRARNEAATV